MLTVILFYRTISYLVTMWNDYSIGEYGHGYLVIVISIYLIVSNRKRLLDTIPCPSYVVTPLVLISSLLWATAVVVDVEMLQSVSLLLLVFSIVWMATGHQAMKLLAFPILFMVFAIPIWFPISPLLQDFTADVVFLITRFLHIPAFRQENLIVIPAGVFSIEEACSGLRYLLAALTLGTLYAYQNYVSLVARITVVLVAAIAAIAANILRVLIVVYVGYATDMQHPWVSDHLMLGWYLFGGLVAIMLVLDARLYRRTATNKLKTIPSESRADPGEKSRGKYFITALLGATFLLIGPVVVDYKEHQQFESSTGFSVILPEGNKDWQGPVKSTNDWMPIYNGAVSRKMDYEGRSGRVTLYVGYYPQQKQGEELINVKNHISHKNVWPTQYTRARNIALHGFSIKEQLIEYGQVKKRLVWYWYDIGGWVTTNKYEAKVLQLFAMLNNNPEAYIVAVSSEITSDDQQARETLNQFIIDLKDPLKNIQVIKE